MAVVVESRSIADVVPADTGRMPRTAEVIDCRGHTLMPGLIDAHAHLAAVDVNILELHRAYPPSLLVAKALRVLEDTLQQGFTAVRDAGGVDPGFRLTLEQGWWPARGCWWPGT
ncbi:MAG: amidohydrolase family protein [Armatimonadota bacterium]|nr:amidohydrolase family protein [Armatimonadota bacterium]MDR7574112.1 amidohydrolase family protein [Armatimonadota bacterium]